MRELSPPSLPDLSAVLDSAERGETVVLSRAGHHAALLAKALRWLPTGTGRAAHAADMPGKQPRVRVEDVHELALGMPHVTVENGPSGNPVYQVGRKSFVFFRTARSDAVDPQTGQPSPDVIVFWVASESEKQAGATPFPQEGPHLTHPGGARGWG